MLLSAAAVLIIASAHAATPPSAAVKPSVVRVRRADGAVKRVRLEGAASTVGDLRAESGAGELFLDEVCERPCGDDAATLASLDVAHGSVVYERRRDAPPPEAAAEPFFSPFPDLAKRKTREKPRTQKNKRVNTWKGLLEEREGVFYVKSLDRVCDVVEVDAASLEAFSATPGAGWLLGGRGVADKNATVAADAAHEAGLRDDDVFAVAAACGLEVVGCVVARDTANAGENITLTPREVAAAAFLQVEAMRRGGAAGGPFSFPVVVAAPGAGAEAFEVSPLAVQMAAEGVLASADAQPEEGLVATTEPVVVDGADTTEVDPRFLYRAVGVAASTAPALSSAFRAAGGEAACAAASSKKARAAALRAHALGKKGAPPSAKKLAKRIADLDFLVRAKKVLAKKDFAACCAAAAARRADPSAVLDATVAAAVVARLEAAGGGGDEDDA